MPGNAEEGNEKGNKEEEGAARISYEGVLNLPLGQSRRRLRQSAQATGEKGATGGQAKDKTQANTKGKAKGVRRRTRPRTRRTPGPCSCLRLAGVR